MLYHVKKLVYLFSLTWGTGGGYENTLYMCLKFSKSKYKTNIFKVWFKLYAYQANSYITRDSICEEFKIDVLSFFILRIFLFGF